MKKKQNKDSKTYFACVFQKMNHFFTLKFSKISQETTEEHSLEVGTGGSESKEGDSCLSNKKMRKIKRILSTSQPGSKLLNSLNYFQVVFH